MKTRFITIQFEVTEDITNDDLHEELCRVFHECKEVGDKFVDGMVDIKDTT